MVIPASRSRLQAGFRGSATGVIGLACVISLIAVAGSLYLSEAAGFIPCRLCWYQRIAMYPLLPVLAVAAWRGDAGVWRYGLPLSVIGFGISAYHVVIQNVPAIEPPVCAGEVPCSAVYVRVFDFVSIPVMAGGAFLGITALLVLGWRIEKP
ncbi:MAG: disulfide bond formation protein B [Gemmatimonadota bacterium]